MARPAGHILCPRFRVVVSHHHGNSYGVGSRGPSSRAEQEGRGSLVSLLEVVIVVVVVVVWWRVFGFSLRLRVSFAFCQRAPCPSSHCSHILRTSLKGTPSEHCSHCLRMWLRSVGCSVCTHVPRDGGQQGPGLLGGFGMWVFSGTRVKGTSLSCGVSGCRGRPVKWETALLVDIWNNTVWSWLRSDRSKPVRREESYPPTTAREPV